MAVTIALVIIIPWMAIGHLLGWKRRNLHGLRERLGFIHPPLTSARRSIWIHCVSVGEVMAARGLIKEISSRHPTRPICLSTVTTTGREIAQKELPGINSLFYLPIDHPLALNRALRRLRPALLIIFETEIWPGLIHSAKKHGTSIAFVNGRISDRSLPRYLRIRIFLKSVLADVDRFLMQSDEDARRIILLGASPSRVQSIANLKWQSGCESAGRDGNAWREELAIDSTQKVLVAGSTCIGEESMLLDAVASLRDRFPNLVVIIAPRKPDRFGEVEQILARSHISFAVRSRDMRKKADIILLDTIGELASLYQIANVVFIGGSLVNVGGHNILEPAACGKPVLFGPHMSNFREMSRLFIENSAAQQVANCHELSLWLTRLLSNSQEAERMGQAGKDLVGTFSGAVQQTADTLDDLLKDS